MDLLELALNPRKANQRMSPFFNELPKGQARKLEYFWGDRATDDKAETILYSRDAANTPATLDLLLKRKAWAVVRPAVRGDLFELIRFANQNGVPIVPRGAGTSGYGGAVPTEGGVVVDLRGFNKVLEIHKAEKWVKVEANATFAQVEKALAAEGLTLRQYPTSFHAATLAGWLSQGGGGIGSLRYGPFRNDVVEVLLLAPNGELHILRTKEELDLVCDTFGTAGFILEVTLRVREAKPMAHFLATFDDGEAARMAARRVALEAKGYNLILLTPEYAELVNQAAGAKLLPTKNGILATLDDAADARATETIKGIVLTGGGVMAKEADAQKAWDNRFNHLNLKRLGPSVVVAETIVHVENLDEGFKAAWGAHKMDRACIWAIAVSPTEMDLIFYGLDDERRALVYPLSMGNALAVIDAVKGVGGRSYGSGVLAAGEAKALLGKPRLKALKKWRKETDKREVFNPGPVTGARTRLMPLPVHDFALQMKLAGPVLKLQRGFFAYPGGDREDPQWQAVSRAVGRVQAGGLGEVANEVATCIFCGMCNAVTPGGRANPWESATPRGRVQLAKAVIDGKVSLSPRVHRNIAWCALEHAPDASCPTSIPIARVTDHLLAACVDAFGPLPEHAALAEPRPADKRGAWVNLGFDPVSSTAFLADDVAAFDAPDVAQSAALVLANAGYPVSHMGKADAGSAAALFETGQRKAADAQVAPFLEALAKKGVTRLVTPDANAARAIALDWPLVGKANEVAVPEVAHTSTLLAEMVKAKKIEFADKLDKKVVVHAPEGLTGAQRAAVVEVAKATGATLLEVPHHDCGHGRGLKLLDEALHMRMAEECLRSAMAAGAQAIVTMSPGCQHTLRTVAKKAKAAIEVLDLHQVVASTMKAREGGPAVAAPAATAEPAKPVEPEIPPDHYRVEFVTEGVVLAVHKNTDLLSAGSEAGLELPSSCKAGSCDTCCARYEGTAPDQSAGSALTAAQQKDFVLTCIARPKGPVRIWSDTRPK